LVSLLSRLATRAAEIHALSAGRSKGLVWAANAASMEYGNRRLTRDVCGEGGRFGVIAIIVAETGRLRRRECCRVCSGLTLLITTSIMKTLMTIYGTQLSFSLGSVPLGANN